MSESGVMDVREAFEAEMRSCGFDVEWSEENKWYTDLKVQSHWNILNRVKAALSHIGDGSKAEPVFTVCGGINYGTSSVSQMVRGPKEVPQGTKLYLHPAPTEQYLSYSPCQSLEHSDDVKILQAQKSDLIRENIQQRRELEAYYAHKMDKTDYPSITGVHYWQGDGEDHLESLCCGVPVVIEAQTLRELLVQDSKVPEGWKLVPLEANKAMSEAGMQVLNMHDRWASGVYQAMVAAAPPLPEEK